MRFNVIKSEPVTCPSVDFKTLSEWSLKSFVMYSPSLVSEQLSRTVVDVNQDEIQTISSDIDLLIRLQNGQKIDKAVAEELLNRMSSGIEDSLKEVFDNASDEDILDSVRSKYIQTPAQLESYLRGLDSRLSEMSSQEIQETIETADIQDTKPIAEPSTE